MRTLRGAFTQVDDGDVIVLLWNVDLTASETTSTVTVNVYGTTLTAPIGASSSENWSGSTPCIE